MAPAGVIAIIICVLKCCLYRTLLVGFETPMAYQTIFITILAVGSVLKKPKFHQPHDNIQYIFQMKMHICTQQSQISHVQKWPC
jgi:hypothetical protein